MNLLKRKTKTCSPHPFAMKVSRVSSAFHIRIAGYLNNRTNKFTLKHQLLFLAVICLLLGGGSFYLLLKVIL